MQDVILEEAIVQEPKKKKYKCPYCEARVERAKLHIHIQNEHEDLIPEGYTALRVAFNTVNNKTEGHCIICKKVTDWNEEKGRYERLCNNPACHEAYKKMISERYNRVYGTDRLQTDPQYAELIQRKALEGRRMSGKYKFADGGEVSYMGTYEKKFLEFMDKVMHCNSEDVVAPGPSIKYMFEGKEHLYLPDFYYVPYNLIIEIKDGGTNKNNHTGIHNDDLIRAKEEGVRKTGEFNYVRVTNNDYGQLLSCMSVCKYHLLHKYYYPDPIFRINESVVMESSTSTLDTIVFDFGGVLIETSKTVENEAWKWAADNGLTKDQMYGLIMKYYEAVQYNEQYTVNQAKDRFRKIVDKEYIKYTDDIFSIMAKGKVLCGHTIAMLNSLKRKGYKLYYLSNVHKAAYEERKDNGLMNFVPKYFIGGLFSFETKYRKPDPLLYKALIKKYKIDPTKSYFIDDKEKNIETANSLGFTGILFDRVGKTTVNEIMHLPNVNTIYESVGDSSMLEDMSGTIGAALPLTPAPMPHESDPSNYYVVQHMQNNVFAYGITKDPLQYTMYSVDPEAKGFYKVYKTDKGKIDKRYLTFKIKDKQSGKELYEQLSKIYETVQEFHDDEYKDYIYGKLTGGSEIITPDQLFKDTRFELVRDFDETLKEDCENLYKWLKVNSIDALEEQVKLLEDYYTDGLAMYNVLPDNIDNLIDLAAWRSRYDAMPYNYRKYSDELSLDLYGDINNNRYTRKYSELISTLDPSINEVPDPSKDSKMISSIIGLLGESASEETISHDSWDLKMERVKAAEADGLIIMVDPDDGFIEDYTEDSIARLKEKYNRLQSLSSDKRVLSSQTASDILGLDNDNLYTKILNIYLTRLDRENDKYNPAYYPNDPDPIEIVPASSEAPSLVQGSTSSEPQQIYSELAILCNALKNTSNKEKRSILKEQISNLGWNPEIPFNEEAINRATSMIDFSNIQEIDATSFLEAQDAVQNLKYTSEELKDKIVPVFVVLTHNVKLRSKSIMWFTDSDYSHASIAFDSSLAEMYTFTIGIDNAPNKHHKTGFAVDTIEHYESFDPHMKTKVYALFVTPEQKARMQEAVQWFIDNQDNTRYGFNTIFNIVMRRPTKKPKDGDKCKMVCSQFVYTILILVNFRLKQTKDPSLVSPGDIDALSNDARFYVVYQGGIDKYDSKKVDALCYKLLPALPLAMYGIDEATGAGLEAPKSGITSYIDEAEMLKNIAESMY